MSNPTKTELAAAYMQALPHTMNHSFFSDAATTGPNLLPKPSPSNTCFTRAWLPHSSPCSSRCSGNGGSTFDRYLRNGGGSPADKRRDRQRKQDGLERRHFVFVIGCLPVALQLALLLLGFALSRYLWTISPPSLESPSQPHFPTAPSKHLLSSSLVTQLTGLCSLATDFYNVDWDGYNVDTCCIAWLLHSIADSVVMYSTGADAIWYSQIIGGPHPMSLRTFPSTRTCLLTLWYALIPNIRTEGITL